MIGSLQSIRFVFALMIFHHHYFTHPQIVQFGTFSVAFFFILSGFVMAIGYENKICSGSFDYNNFIKRRLLKIIPLNFFCLTLYCIFPVYCDITSHQFELKKYLCYIIDALLIQSWIPIKEVYFSGNAVAWFLSSILFCYLLFPFLLRFLKGVEGYWTMGVVLVLYFTLLPFIKTEWIHPLIYISPLFRSVDFMIGIILYFCLKENLDSIPINKQNALLGTFIELVSIAVAVVTLVLYSHIPVRYSISSFYWIPSVLLIFAFVKAEKLGGAISCFLCKPFMVYLGKLGFPFYMMHTIIINWCRQNPYIWPYSETKWCAVLCIIIVTNLAYLYVEYIEPLSLRTIKKIIHE